MPVKAKFSRMLKLKPEESRSFRFLFMLSLVTGIALSFYFVAVNSFLIKNTSVSNLPFAYIISGLGGVLLIKIYQSRQRKVGIIRSYQEFLCTFSVVSLIVFLAYGKFGDQPSDAVYLAYFGFLFNMPFTIIFALSFSAICARLYNISQSKRLLALVGTGEIIASIIGYLFAPLLSKILGSANYLLPVSAACILPAFFPIFKLFAENKEKLKHIATVKRTLKKLNISFFLSQRFYLLIALVSVFSVAAIYFVDYACLITVRFMASYSGLEIAVIVGVFFSCVKTGELIFSFLSAHILSSKGVKFSILLLPILLVGCFVFAVIGGATFQSNPIFILCFIFLAKFVERVIRKAITTPATKVLYQVTGSDRLRIEATIEGLLNQIATVVSGLLLLLISALISKDDTQYFLTVISGICFTIFFAWSVLSLKLYENYKKKIWSYLTEIRSFTASENDGALVAKPVYVNTDSDLLSSTLERALRARADGKLNTGTSKLSSSYYTNPNFFYRLTVIRFFQTAEKPLLLTLFKEFWEISDLTLKYELIHTFNTFGEKPAESDYFYFEELCQQFSDELIYAMSAQNDLQFIEDPGLQFHLKEHTQLLIKVLFELLSVLYEPKAIKVIYDIIASEDQDDIESKLFAIELLDNTLDEVLKDKFTPIFEPAPFDQKIGNLQKFIPVEPMSAQEALKNLLLKDFKLVNHHLKECCLSCYYQLSKDKQMLNAFKVSKIKNLQVKAEKLSKKEFEINLSIQETLLKEIESRFLLSKVQLTYLFNDGIVTNESSGHKVNRKSEHPYVVPIEINGSSLLFDTYALALLIEPNYSGA